MNEDSINRNSEGKIKLHIEENNTESNSFHFILRPKIQRIFPKSWILCIILYVLFFIIRGFGCLGPEYLRILILVSFILMWPLPFIFYSKDGWKQLGIKKIEKPLWILWGILLGISSAFVVYLIGWGLFGNTNDHWFISILNQVISEEDRVGMSIAILFLIVTGPAMIFSPIGEELFFRGMINEVFNKIKSKWLGGLTNSLAFALIHIFHYGIAYDPSTGLEVHPWTGLLWFILMTGVSGIFTLCREKSNSIIPAILSHSAFNLMMNVTIFVFLI